MTDELDQFANELQELVLEDYSETVKREFQNPKNIGIIENPDIYVSVTGVCGDTIEMSLSIENERIEDIKFMTDGCGTTIICASYVTRIAKKKSLEEMSQLTPEDVDNYFEGLPEESKHCAKLAVDTLQAAIRKYYDET